MLEWIMFIIFVCYVFYGCLQVFYTAKRLDDRDKFNYEEKRKDSQ